VVPRSDDGAKALALLQGRAPEKKAEVVEGRFVVQVGAFAEEAGARTVRLKVEAAGLKTYTHVAQTKEGSRIRVRTGPYSTRAEAEKAAEKIKKLGLPAAILTL
jgi:DedD protein